MPRDLIIVLSGIVGTIGFSILFGVKKRNLLFAILGGFVAGVVYVLTQTAGTFAASAAASFAATMYCEIIARVRKAPVVTFLTPSIVVLVPGSALYYTVANLIAKKYDDMWTYGFLTIDACLGISAGILVASLVFTVFLNVRKKIAAHKAARVQK